MNSTHSSLSLPLKDNIDFVSNIETWEDCKSFYSNLKPGKYIFRGLSSSNYDLESTFDRACKKNNIESTEETPKWKYEAVMLFNFMRIAHQYVKASNLPPKKDNLEWLSLLRHYGAPSRLMDFTYSFYIAAYFAIEGADINDKNDSAIIWVIDFEWLSNEARNLVDELCKANNIKDRIFKDKIFQDPKLFNKIVINYQDPIDFVIPINPFRYNRRIHLQQGIFLLPCNIENTFEQNLVSVPGINKKRIMKIKLKKDQKKNIIEDLNQMNISLKALFGDLEGVARSLNDFFCMDYRLSTKEELLYYVLGLDYHTH